MTTANATATTVVDGDPGLRALLLAYLAGDDRVAAEAVAGLPDTRRDRTGPDVLLIDLSGARDGDGRCRILRPRSELSALMLLAADADDSAAHTGANADAGASGLHAFFTRGLAIRRLFGAPRAADEPEPPRAVRFAGWRLDLRRRRLEDEHGSAITLPPTEFSLLAAFLDRPREVLTREALIEGTRGPYGYTSARTLDVYVSRLRRRLRGSDRGPNLISTRRKQGYALDADVTLA